MVGPDDTKNCLFTALRIVAVAALFAAALGALGVQVTQRGRHE